jgi:hypothetical protein
MSSKVGNEAMQEPAELECYETTREILALFPSGSTADHFRFMRSLDIAQRAQLEREIDRIHEQADKRFRERARARGVSTLLSPRFSALNGPEARAMGIEVIGFETSIS